MRFAERIDRTRRQPSPAVNVGVDRGPLRRFAVPILVLVGALLVAVYPGAHAITLTSNVPSPEAPRPINVLPSTIKGSLPVLGATAQQNYLATLLYSYGRSPSFWQAVAAKGAGTATAGQLTLIQQTNGNWGVPATKPSALTRVGGGVGGAAAVVSGFSIGTTLGAGLLNLVGTDASGHVCSSVVDGGVPDWLATITGYSDCGSMRSFEPAYVPNDGLVAGTNWGTMVCHKTHTDVCVRFTSILYETAGSTQRYVLCVARSWITSTAPTGASHLWASVTFAEGAGREFNIGGISQANSTNQNVRDDDCIPIAPDTTIGTRVNLFGSNVYGSPVVSIAWRLESAAGYDDATTIPTEISANPERVLKCVVAWDGGSAFALSEPYFEDDGVLPAPNCPDPPSGLAPTSVEVFEVINGEEGLLWEMETTPEYDAALALAPECMEGTCLLDLTKDGVGSCFQSPTQCVDWYTDPDKATKYSCLYGTHVVDLAECTVYAPTFQPGASTTGNVYGDPESGAAVTNPTPTPGSDPDGSGQACWPSGWAVFNPLEWVYRPIVCAASWAFVPRQEVLVTVANRTSNAWNGTIVGQGIQMASGVGGVLPEGVTSDCSGPPVTFGPPLDDLGIEGTYYPLNSCDEPMSTVRTVAYWALPAFMAFGLLFALIRYIAAILGYVPLGGPIGYHTKSTGVHFE